MSAKKFATEVVVPPKKNSGRILIQPLSRNTAQGASRNQDGDGQTSIRNKVRAHHVFTSSSSFLLAWQPYGHSFSM
jgi:hypothetical protein